jgi:hemoglobin-like flavoprotein
MNPDQIDRIQTTFRRLALRGPELFAGFAERVCAASPALHKLLPTEPREHAQPSLAAVGLIVKNLHRLGPIEYLLAEMGARNQMLGVQPQHYGVAREAMVATLREALGQEWDEELEGDWTEAIQTVTSLMIRGAGRARAKAA